MKPSTVEVRADSSAGILARLDELVRRLPKPLPAGYDKRQIWCCCRCGAWLVCMTAPDPSTWKVLRGVLDVKLGAAFDKHAATCALCRTT